MLGVTVLSIGSTYLIFVQIIGQTADENLVRRIWYNRTDYTTWHSYCSAC